MQNNLGNALTTLGEREAATTHLEEGVAAYYEAFEERTRERTPLDWATTQTSLGIAFIRLGQRDGRDGASGGRRLRPIARR